MQLGEVGGVDAARISAVAVIELVVRLVAGHAQLIDVDHHDIIAAIDVRREFRLVLAAQPVRERCGEPAEHLVLSVDYVPVALDFMGFRRKSLHNKLTTLKPVEPLPMTDEPGRGIGFQRQMSLDGARFRSSSKDDREPKDTAVEQPGTGALFHGRHRRRPVCHPGAPGSLPVGRPEPEAVWLRAIAPRRAWPHRALPVQGHRLLPRTGHAPDCAVALRWPPERPARAACRTLCQALRRPRTAATRADR